MKDTNKGFIYMMIGVFLFSILSIMVKIVYSMGISETTLTPLFSLFVFILCIKAVFSFYLNWKKVPVNITGTFVVYLFIFALNTDQTFLLRSFDIILSYYHLCHKIL